MRLHHSLLFIGVSGALLVLGACGGNVAGIDPNANEARVDSGTFGNADAGPGWTPQVDVGPPTPDMPGPNGDAFFAADPPPQYCGPSDNSSNNPPLPGGTPECPDDKNREGCPCPEAGKTAPCWPGLRVNRNRGICKDGVTTCEQVGELHRRWGKCEGYTLPTDGVTQGPESCGCFSAGRWALSNLTVCFVQTSRTPTFAFSPYLDSAGQPRCPQSVNGIPPAAQPNVPWSPNTLEVDCAGQFKLCYTVKAGDAKNPSPNDCTVAQSCTEAWYAEKGAVQELPPLPSWVSDNHACARKLIEGGGYGEMTVVGKSVECETIDDAGKPLVFNRLTYCSLRCAQQPSLPGCEKCTHMGDGRF